jgi:hypothetical protein
MITRLGYALILISICILCLSGCGDPYLDSSTSTALSSRDQLSEMQKQTAILERQNEILEKISSKLDEK